jgi:hypothetical protein
VDEFYTEAGSEEDGIPQGALTVSTKEWAKVSWRRLLDDDECLVCGVDRPVAA